MTDLSIEGKKASVRCRSKCLSLAQLPLEPDPLSSPVPWGLLCLPHHWPVSRAAFLPLPRCRMGRVQSPSHHNVALRGSSIPCRRCLRGERHASPRHLTRVSEGRGLHQNPLRNRRPGAGVAGFPCPPTHAGAKQLQHAS